VPNSQFQKSAFFLIINLLIFFFPSHGQESSSLIGQEQLKYRIHLGFINAAQATIKSSAQTIQMGNKSTRKIEIEGKTIGILEVISPVVDYWSSYLDIQSRIPLKTEMKKKEGRYRKEETVVYDQEKGIAKISSPQNTPTEKNMAISKGMLDIIGGYYFLRDKNLADMKPGQKLSAKVLMDGSIYEIWFVVKGFEKVESKFGSKNCIRTSLVLPKNNLFEDKDAIRLWISQDKNQIPFKMEVSLKIGFLTIDLEEYLIQGKPIYALAP
jgi:hypothetical protein